MSVHRRPCTAEAPDLIGFRADHVHQCIHDAADDGGLLEHECICGVRWQARRPAPDLSWLKMETVREPWPMPLVLGAVALIMAVLGAAACVGVIVR